MTDHEAELLRLMRSLGPILLGNEEALTSGRLDARPMGERSPDEWPWLRPMDVGGASGSWHGMTLKRMAKKGWVQQARRSDVRPYLAGDGDKRPSYYYRVTKEGRDALENHHTLHPIKGG